MLTSKRIPVLKSVHCAALLCLMLPGVSHAQVEATPIAAQTQASQIVDTGDSQRVDYAGKLRMLSQLIPAAACNLQAGIATEQSQAKLGAAIAEYTQILNALEFGDADLGIIGAEERQRTVVAIDTVRQNFLPLKAALDASSDGIPGPEALAVVAEGNMDLLKSAQDLVPIISGQYANQAVLLQSDIMAMDLAGRQRLLTQKISKDICFIQSGVQAEESRADMEVAIGNFEMTLNALQGGAVAIGLQPAPNAEIREGLEEVRNDWFAIKAQVDQVKAGQSLSPEDRAIVFLGLNKTLADMNRVVGLYSDASKLGL